MISLLLALLSTAAVTEGTTSLAIDFVGATDDVTFSCIKSLGVATVGVRVFDPDSGTPDLHAPNTIKLALAAGLTVEAVHAPSPSQSPNTQIDFAITNLKNAGLNVRRMWIQVTDAARWGANTTNNRIFVIEAAQRIWRYGILAGIYTNLADWRSITLDLDEGLPNTPLWYVNTKGDGVSGETSPTFADFAPFGPWLRADIKKYGAGESVCGLVGAGRDVICLDGMCESSTSPTASTGRTWPTSGVYTSTTARSSPYPLTSTSRPILSSLRPSYSTTQSATGTTVIPHVRPCTANMTTCAEVFRDDCAGVMVWGWEWLYSFDAGYAGNIKLAYVMKGCTLQLFDAIDWKGTEKDVAGGASGSWTELGSFNAASAKCMCK